MLDVKILGDLEMDDVNTKLCVDEFYPKRKFRYNRNKAARK